MHALLKPATQLSTAPSLRMGLAQLEIPELGSVLVFTHAHTHTLLFRLDFKHSERVIPALHPALSPEGQELVLCQLHYAGAKCCYQLTYYWFGGSSKSRWSDCAGNINARVAKGANSMQSNVKTREGIAEKYRRMVFPFSF